MDGFMGCNLKKLTIALQKIDIFTFQTETFAYNLYSGVSRVITRAETENSKAFFIQDNNVLIHKIDFFHLLINESVIITFSSQRPATFFCRTRF